MSKKKSTKRWTSEYAQRVLERADASGLTDHGYAVRHGVDPQRLYWWRERLREKRRVHGAAFVEVTAPAQAPRARPDVEVVLCNGRRVLVPHAVELQRLSALLDVIEGRG
jgi:transposase-like protein